MIIEVTKDNLERLDDSFLNSKLVKEEFSNNPFAKIIAYKEDKLLGYIYYSDIYERVEINQFEVDSFHRNCGIGKKLLQELIKNVNKEITLEVRKDNKIAIKLYKEFGFQEKAIREGYYNGIDGILMERDEK